MSKTVNLNQTQVFPGNVVQCGGDPYTVTELWTIVVPDGTTQDDINALGPLLRTPVAGGGLAPIRFAKTFQGVDAQSAADQPLFTVPASATVGCFPTKITCRNASGVLTGLSGGFGFNTDRTNVAGPGTPGGEDALSDPTYYADFPVNAEATRGAAGDVFGFKSTTQTSGAATFDVDVEGYYL